MKTQDVRGLPHLYPLTYIFEYATSNLQPTCSNDGEW
jgi:hypothetical protein